VKNDSQQPHKYPTNRLQTGEYYYKVGYCSVPGGCNQFERMLNIKADKDKAKLDALNNDDDGWPQRQQRRCYDFNIIDVNPLQEDAWDRYVVEIVFFTH
jgi:hypothetical protein